MKEISKFLSLVLRHAPDRIGLALDAQGWADVDELIEKSRRAGKNFDRARLAVIVAANDKKRFTFSEDGSKIRAAQGHSVAVDLGLPPQEPPAVLFHGTATTNVASIRTEGLIPGRRRQVHLAIDVETAMAVGRRHGRPVLLRVAAGRMHAEGFLFWRAENGVWLTDAVPPRFIYD